MMRGRKLRLHYCNISVIMYESRDLVGISMPDIERLTITLPTDMAAVIKSAVANGDYASTSEVIREAVRDWKMKRGIRVQEFASFNADIDKGLADVVAGRVKDFDADTIIARGRKILANRSTSA